MKRFNFLLMAIAIVLTTVTAVSCTTMAGTEDGYYDGYPTRVYGNRVYVDDPYRGTIVLERDARTGRYYEVGSPYYNGYYGNRNYGRGHGYGNVYRGRSNDRNYRNNNNNQNNQRPTQEDRKSRDEARDKVLGKH